MEIMLTELLKTEKEKISLSSQFSRQTAKMFSEQVYSLLISYFLLRKLNIC